MSLDRGRSRQSDLEELLEASHAEVAHMQQQIAATTAAIASSRGSSFSQVHYSAPGDADYSEDSLIRSAVMRCRCQALCSLDSIHRFRFDVEHTSAC